MEKLCNSCKCKKPPYEFPKSRSSDDGLMGVCKVCKSNIRAGNKRGKVEGKKKGKKKKITLQNWEAYNTYIGVTPVIKYRLRACEDKNSELTTHKTKAKGIVCYFCEESKAIQEFPRGTNNLNDDERICKRCNIFKRSIANKYELSAKEYLHLAEKQKNCCGICMERKPRRELFVDHCHNSDRVRGLLCRTCNIALGYFKDDEQYLLAAINYLKKADQVNVVNIVNI